MADVYGRLTGKAGVCIATLGPGAINLMLGVTDANSDSAPVVAITAQVGLDRIYKETHQYVDLKSIFKNITKWSDTVYTTDSIPEMIRMAFDKAQCERPGAAYLGIPQDIEYAPVPQTLSPIRQHPRHTIFPDADYVNDAAKMLGKAKSPIILIGHGAVRSKAKEEIRALCDYMKIPVTTTFMAKGIVSDRKEYVLGCAGFMDHDYPDFSFDQADLILSIGYEFAEFSPAMINPQKDKNIININTFCEDLDACFIPQINIIGDIKENT